MSFVISATIIKGKGRGKSILGYATANTRVILTELRDKQHIPAPYRDNLEGAWCVNIKFVGVNTKSKRGLTQPPSYSSMKITDKEGVNAVCGVCKKGSVWILET